MLPALIYTVRHYGRNYSVISEKSECGRLLFYATIESLYGANRFTVTVRKRNGNFSMTPTVHGVSKYCQFPSKMVVFTWRTKFIGTIT